MVRLWCKRLGRWFANFTQVFQLTVLTVLFIFGFYGVVSTQRNVPKKFFVSIHLLYEMSVEKDPLALGEDEELGAEDELVLELDDEDVQVFSCKYCEFETESVEDLDEHIIKHDEAILENSDGDESDEADHVLHQAPEHSSVSPIASHLHTK